MKKNEFNSTYDLDETVKKLIEFKSEFKDHPFLLNIINTRNVNQVDEYGQTIMHHVIKDISQETIKTAEQLKKIVDIVNRLATLISDNALNLPDNLGQSALDVAANCEVREIFWAMCNMELPNYEIPLFPKTETYSSSYKSPYEASSFVTSSWGVTTTEDSSITGAHNYDADSSLQVC